ncbi:MAG TPA: cellulase family glycosylhydrolase [Chloroflexia bacterium]|nr:cellulase family glycosylhydrolase [Chloroflexia bacterium]
MRASGPHIHSGKAVVGIALGLVLLILIIGCDSTPAIVSTPTSVAPNLIATPTQIPPTATVERASPTTTSALSTATPASAWSPSIQWRGGEWYLLGVNYPYYHYGNDFGGNVWGSYGVHDPSTNAEVDADFEQMSAMGIRTVRWFVFADGRAGITYDAAGMPSGIDEFVTKDFDAALEIAQRHNIGINFVLLDFRFMYDAQTENGVQLGGHAAVLATPAGQEALVHNVFEPIFRKYANNPAILSWEVMNEPEWTLRDAGTVHKEVSQPLTLADFRAFAKLTIESIHSIAGSYATIGGADMKWAQNWMGLGLDYYQIHFYDWMSPYSTDNLFTMRAESLRLDRPVVVGEFPADHSTVAGLRDYLNDWYTMGYAGAWAWSFRADATWGGPDPEVLSSWAEAHKTTVDIPPAP